MPKNNFIVCENAVHAITHTSQNSKTGDLTQITHYDRRYYETLLQGDKVETQDNHIGAKCSGCNMKEPCYTTWRFQKLKATIARKSYTEINHLGDLKVYNNVARTGEYGDPSSLTLREHAILNRKFDTVLSYSHFWNEIDTRYSKYLMASVETLKDTHKALELGYRVFFVNGYKEYYSQEILKKIGLINCPFESKKVQCVQCKLCNGKKGTKDKRKSIHVSLHGSNVKTHKSFDLAYWLMMDSVFKAHQVSSIEEILKLIEESK